MAAGELATGDTLYLADGGRADIVSVTREKLATPVDVYNVEVADFHTYFVASTGVWVHNCGGEAAETAREIVFKEGSNGLGHGARHLAEEGLSHLSQPEVEEAIRLHVLRSTERASAIGWFEGQVVLNGTDVGYRAWGLANGAISVGSYFDPILR